MAGYFIESELRLLARQEGVRSREAADALLTEIQTMLDREMPGPLVIDQRTVPAAVFDVFLSYSSADVIAVVGLYHWLKSYHYTVYLDCFDAALGNPAIVTRATAEILRRRMVQSSSLFVATTQSTPSSTWVPWELGFTDGLTNKAAVLYIAPDQTVTFNRQSYFEMYPEVQRDDLESKPYDLMLSDALAIPPLSCDWGTWLRLPKRY